MQKLKPFFRHTVLILVALFSSQLSFGQFDIPEKPNLETSVYDYAGILSKGQALYLEQKLINYADTTYTNSHCHSQNFKW